MFILAIYTSNFCALNWIFRFKQIREQERRRRQLREEEKRKAEEAPRGADVINEKHKQEDDLVKVEGGTGKSAIITNNSSEKSAIITNNSSDAGATVADGTQSTRDLKEDKAETVIHKATNGGLSHNGGSATKDELRSFGNLKKVVITLEFQVNALLIFIRNHGTHTKT